MRAVRAIPMTRAHLDQVYQIEVQCFTTPWTLGMLQQELENPHIAHYLVLVDDQGDVIAYGGFWKIDNEGHVTNIAVRPDCQGQGYGRYLFTALLALAADQGIMRMTMEVRASNQAAQHLYNKNGFMPVGVRRGYYQNPREDAIIMWNEDIAASLAKARRRDAAQSQ